MPTGEVAAYPGLSHEAHALLYQRQFTPMTNFSNHGNTDSIPVEKNVLEGLIKENQGLKQEANRNNMILDLLTSRTLSSDALFKKQTQAGSASLIMNGNQKLPNPRLREEPRTADGTRPSSRSPLAPEQRRTLQSRRPSAAGAYQQAEAEFQDQHSRQPASLPKAELRQERAAKPSAS